MARDEITEPLKKSRKGLAHYMKQYNVNQLHNLTAEILDTADRDSVVKIDRTAWGDRHGHQTFYIVSEEAMTGQAREAIIEAYQPRNL